MTRRRLAVNVLLAALAAAMAGCATSASTLVRLHSPQTEACPLDSSGRVVVAVRAATRVPLGPGVVRATVDSVDMGAPFESLPSPELTFNTRRTPAGRHRIAVTSTRYGRADLTIALQKCEVAIVAAVLQ